MTSQFKIYRKSHTEVEGRLNGVYFAVYGLEILGEILMLPFEILNMHFTKC